MLAGRQLGAKDPDAASRTVTTVIGLSVAASLTNIAADALTIPVCLFSIPAMKRIASRNMSLNT